MKNSDKRFRVSSNKRNTSVLALLGSFIATLIIENSVTDIDEKIVSCILIAVAVGVAAALLCIVFVKEYYMQVLDDGFELEKGKKITKYDFSAFAGSHVTRHYMNGIYTGTSREISIKEASGKTVKINANNLSKGRFVELVTYLGQARFTASHDIEASAEYFKNGIDFFKGQKNVELYYLFSDDKEYLTKELIPYVGLHEKEYIIVQNGADKGYFDLLLMSRCNFVITSKGTLGKYGALLDLNRNKTVVVCKDDKQIFMLDVKLIEKIAL